MSFFTYNKKQIIFIAALFLLQHLNFAQTKTKQLQAVRITTPPKINGMLDDDAWKNVPIAADFIQYKPNNGDTSNFKTKVKIIYDDNAIYVGALLYDPAPDKIPCELGMRDDYNLNTDYFRFDIDPFNDGQHSLSFSVSSSGIQCDSKFNGGEQDYLWDAVWQSAIAFTDEGWSVEFKIPWSALRFPKTLDKIWAVNFWRTSRNTREISSWNPVDNSKEELTNQMGELTGITNIHAPLRLSFVPYVSFYLDHYPYNTNGIKNTSTIFNGGMDLKFGLSESFTLDMTLIPDFGQVQSDNIILNLTPFEVKFDEKRQFFTEGTELFSRADLFYSRRIGNTPIGYDSASTKLNKSDTLINNPSQTQLLNATKISGRTSKGLGIGFFNATTDNAYATIKDSLGNKRKLLTQPLTNYNIIVLDQSFMKNSYASLINTNVYYDKGGKMANVSGTEFKIADKKNMYAITGSAALSQKFDSLNISNTLGHKYEIAIGKISGNLHYAFINSQLSNTFDPNDLGYLEYNNEMENTVQVDYNLYNPFWKLLNMLNTFEISHKDLYLPRKFTSLELSEITYATFKNYLTVNITLDYTPVKSNDYYEPREPGLFLVRSPNWYITSWLSTDYRKSFALDCSVGYLKALGDVYKDSFWWSFAPRIRISDHCLLTHSFSLDHEWHDFGYATFNNNSVIIGKRDVKRVENVLTVQYIFRKDVSLSFRARHYWSTVKYLDYYTLQDNGQLQGNADPNENFNTSFNAFNIDMVFTWRFAPGSQMDIVWKNEILTNNIKITIPFNEDFSNTLDSPQLNSISVKILYYLDYMYLKKKK